MHCGATGQSIIYIRDKWLRLHLGAMGGIGTDRTGTEIEIEKGTEIETVGVLGLQKKEKGKGLAHGTEMMTKKAARALLGMEKTHLLRKSENPYL